MFQSSFSVLYIYRLYKGDRVQELVAAGLGQGLSQMLLINSS